MKNILIMIILSSAIYSCSKNRTPEEVVRDFTIYVSTGECEKAMELCTGDAELVVQGTIDSGCHTYKTTIDSISCEISGDSAKCFCYETRPALGSVCFPYNLLKMDGEWKLTTNTKDSETAE